MNDLSDKITTEAIQYLGPAARVFLERQTKKHMNGLAFSSIEKKHCTELAKWVYFASAVLIDKDKAKELSVKIFKMAL
jgi:hypothetical protein